MKTVTSSIHIWTPGICEGSGGIQAFSRFFVEAIHQIFPQAALRVIVKHDAPGLNDPLRSLPVSFHSVCTVPAALRTAVLAGIGIGLGLRDSPVLALTTHVHFLPALSLLHRLKGIPCVAVLHGIEAWNLQGGRRVKALRSADRLIAVSRFTRDRVVHKHGVDAGRVEVVPNTFDAARFAPGPKPAHLLARFGLRPDQPVLLTISRLDMSERYKGHREVLHALPQIREKFPNVRYLIGGDGNDLPNLREKARVLQLDEHVSFAGHVPGEQLPDFYRLCDAFVMPSTSEGFGIVFLEALASGRPCIVGNLDASPEAIGDGRLGFAVDPRSPAEIAEAVVKLLGRQHNKPWLHEPETLRSEILECFGFAAFKRRLAHALSQLPVGALHPLPAIP